MSDESRNTDPPPSPKPGEKFPEIDLPKPDGLNVPKITATADSMAREQAVNDAHPSAVFNKSRAQADKERRRKGCGCLTTLLMGLVLAGIALAGVYVWEVKPFVDRGFAQVISPPPVAVAPEADTLYVGAEIVYQAPATARELCIVAGKAELSGDFSGKVSFRGGTLILKPGAKFPGGLDAFAAQLVDEGAQLPAGHPTGRILSRE